MYESEYNKKVLEFIESNNIEEVMKDPTPQFLKEINNCLNHSKQLMNDNEIRGLKTIKPYAPVLRGLPKVHKDNMPIRPLVNYTSAPAYRTAKKLDNIIRNNINLNPSHSLKNSLELVDNIRNVPINPGQNIMSLDVDNMYTNIPVDEAIETLKIRLKENNSLNDVKINEVCNLAKLITKQNYFQFNDKYYIQREGLAMGSPLSSILAEIYLNDFENKHIMSHTNKFRNSIVYYYRYVDDAICLFKGNSRQIDLFTKRLNAIHPKIKFKREIEHENKINYLDLTIHTHENKHQFSVFHKPTQSSQVIHASSNHPISHKLAAFNSFIHRLNKIPMTTENYNKELNIIKYIAQDNGYDSSIIDKINRKNKSQVPNARNIEKKFVTLTYGSSLNHKTSNVLKSHGYTVAYRNSNKLENIINPRKTSNGDEFDGSGVYKVKCNDCPKYYIGQTGRSFRTRFKEHLPKKTVTQKSNYAEHLVQCGHNYSSLTNNLKVMHKCNKSRLLSTLENYEIYKAVLDEPDNVLNDKINSQANTLFDTAMRLERKDDVTGQRTPR